MVRTPSLPAPLRDRARWPGLAAVRPTGRAVLLLGVVAGLLALALGWRELAVLALTCLLALLLAAPFLLGRTRVAVELSLEPDRVVAGESVVAGVAVRNLAQSRMLPSVLEVPVGAGTHHYALPSLAPDAAAEESFTIRTERRGVIPVGPVRTRRGDPLGLLSREVEWTGVHEVLVRPPMVPLSSMGAGLLRDLEGVATDAVSQSDLAFHALREYVPGDDLRHVHWRSSAKAMASAGENALLVRQYLDTRRSHATVVVDDRAEAWRSVEDFETAMSVAASILVRALGDEFDVSFVCGAQVATGHDGRRALDAVCRAVLGTTGLVDASRRAAASAPGTSLAFLVTGPRTGFTEVHRAGVAFPAEVRRLALLVDGDGTARLGEAGGMPVLHLAAKEELGALLRGSAR